MKFVVRQAGKQASNNIVVEREKNEKNRRRLFLFETVIYPSFSLLLPLGGMPRSRSRLHRCRVKVRYYKTIERFSLQP